MPAFDAERAALILVDATVLGDKAAAGKWECSVRTVLNHRGRLRTDPHFASLFREKLTASEGEWKTVRLRFLRKAIAKLEELVERATAEQIRDVATAVKTVGELQVVSDALNPDAGTTREGKEPATSPGGNGSGGEPTSVHSSLVH